MIFRTLICATAIFLLALRAWSADNAEEEWKSLVMQGLYAAGANDFSGAERIFVRALHEAEHFGADDARVGTTLNSLGLVYRSRKKSGDAEIAFRRALAILDKAYGSGSIDVANVSFNLAAALTDQGKQPAAVPFLQKSLLAYGRQLGGCSLKTAAVLCMLGDSYRTMMLFEEAEEPLKRCASIRESEGGLLNSPDLGDALNSLALVYQKEGKYALADPVFKLTETIRERTAGVASPALAETLEAHSAILRQMGRAREADEDAVLAAAIRHKENKGK